MPFADLVVGHRVGDAVETADLPHGTTQVQLSTPFGVAWTGGPAARGVRAEGLPAGTYRLEAFAGGRGAGWTTVTIGGGPSQLPVPAFATQFGSMAMSEAALKWLRELRADLVQVYDWMASYVEPLPEAELYWDPLKRRLLRSALDAMIGGILRQGALAQAYAPIVAAGPDYASAHPAEALVDEDGRLIGLGDLLTIMNPADTAWRAQWLDNYGRAVQALGFDAVHLDTYGYPRVSRDSQGGRVNMVDACQGFVDSCRRAWPGVLLTFNQVNGYPHPFTLPSTPAARYIEVWPPNIGWRHLEGLLGRTCLGADEATILAIYPPVWGTERSAALRTCGLTEAIVTQLGAAVLMHGDFRGVLCDPYYPQHVTLGEDEAALLLQWHLFALQCRDLFSRGTDTSWMDLGDPNGAVTVSANLPSSPEPVAGHLHARVARGDGWIAIGLINLSGSPNGLWTEPCERPSPATAVIEVLVPNAERWVARVAELDRAEGRFGSVPCVVADSHAGPRVRVRLGHIIDWAVLVLSDQERT